MKKGCRILSAFLGITLLFSLSAFATNLGTLTYWYSDASQIGRWNATSLVAKTEKLNNNSSFYLATGMNHACSEWSDALNTTITYAASSYTNVPLKVYGGTRSEINATGCMTILSSQTGLTVITSSLEGTWTYNGNEKNGRKITKAIVAVVDDGYSLAQTKKTCSHELGHALGWYGHSSNSSDVMYAYASSITSLTNRDIFHLRKVYNT